MDTTNLKHTVDSEDKPGMPTPLENLCVEQREAVLVLVHVNCKQQIIEENQCRTTIRGSPCTSAFCWNNRLYKQTNLEQSSEGVQVLVPNDKQHIIQANQCPTIVRGCSSTSACQLQALNLYKSIVFRPNCVNTHVNEKKPLQGKEL
jgi:hypothetical protein